MKKVYVVGGEQSAETFLVNIALPNKVLIQNVEVTRGELLVDADMLIGMDIMNRGDFAVTNLNGVTMFSFRVPSSEAIDFTVAIKAARTRRDPNAAPRRTNLKIRQKKKKR